jgi:hypothetical protein
MALPANVVSTVRNPGPFVALDFRIPKRASLWVLIRNVRCARYLNTPRMSPWTGITYPFAQTHERSRLRLKSLGSFKDGMNRVDQPFQCTSDGVSSDSRTSYSEKNCDT